VNTTTCWAARIRRAVLQVIAVQRLADAHSAYAKAAAALVTQRARVEVVARHLVAQVQATQLRVARIVRAQVAIITVDGRGGLTAAVAALVARCASAAVFALDRVVGVLTA